MQVIEIQEFIDAMSRNPGVYILSIRAKTIPDHYKTNNPYLGRFHKISIANGTVGADYEKAVNRELEKQGLEPDFEAGPHQWATYVNRHLRTNKDESHFYLSFIEKRRREFWFLDNKPVDYSVLAPWIKPKKDGVITYRNWMVDHLLSFKWRKKSIALTGQRPKHVYPVTQRELAGV